MYTHKLKKKRKMFFLFVFFKLTVVAELIAQLFSAGVQASCERRLADCLNVSQSDFLTIFLVVDSFPANCLGRTQ
jgi:hypothetical protein